MGDFPRIQHLPGSHTAPDDLMMDRAAAHAFLQQDLVVMEKMDGLNVAVDLVNGEPRARLKRAWRGALDGAVERAVQVHLWQHRTALRALLRRGGTAYGEWLWHRVSVPYTRLQDVMQWFALDDPRGGMLPVDQALAALQRAGLPTAVPVWRGRGLGMATLRTLVGRSAQGPHRMEGLILEHTGTGWPRHAKWVARSYRHVTPGRLSGALNGLAPDAPALRSR